jgi:hypothetical protein
LKALFALLITLLVSLPAAFAGDDLVVYPPVPGLAGAEGYSSR